MIRFIFGWMVSAWFFAEILIFFPSLGPVFHQVESFLSIPTHDKWNLVRIQEERDWLGKQIAEAKSHPFVSRVFQGSVRMDSFLPRTNSRRPLISNHFVSLSEPFLTSDEILLFDPLQDFFHHT